MTHETFEAANIRRNREAFEAELEAFKDAARRLSNRWAIIEDPHAVDGYPSWMPSFDEAEAAIAKMTPHRRWTDRTAHLALTADVNGWDFGGLPISYAHAGGGIDCLQIDLDGEAFIWVSESLADGKGWQCCLYLGGDHEGYYLTGYTEYPTDAEQLRQTVADLIAARDLVASVHDALFGLAAGAGLILVLKGGGAVVGTLQTAFRGAHWVTVAQDGRQTRTLALTDIAKVQVI